MSAPQRLHVAVFAIDGELIGCRTRPLSELSGKWLGVCSKLIADHGPLFDVSLDQMLGHIKVKFTSAQGAALVELSAHGVHALSAAYFSGTSIPAERQVQSLLLSSLRSLQLVQQAASTDKPFEEMLGLAERPLSVLIFFGSPGVSEQDNNLAAELAEHLAGAFFVGQSQGVA